MNTYHISVLLEEAIDGLIVKSGKKYIDATLGGGGHTEKILSRGGIVLGIDQDQDALDYVSSRLNSDCLTLVKGNFSSINHIASENAFLDVSGVLFDLGISSHQIDTAERGFSYLLPGPLDMRMDRDLGVSAKDLVNGLGRNELTDLFRDLGEERRARKVTDAIVDERKKKPIETTQELVEILVKAYGFRQSSDFAKSEAGKRVFQALRLKVNLEIESLKEALPKAFDLLKENGRLVVISFHSLEDRTVKDLFKKLEQEGKGKIITKKPITPSESEITMNKRSKSAKLRIIEKI